MLIIGLLQPLRRRTTIARYSSVKNSYLICLIVIKTLSAIIFYILARKRIQLNNWRQKTNKHAVYKEEGRLTPPNLQFVLFLLVGLWRKPFQQDLHCVVHALSRLAGL